MRNDGGGLLSYNYAVKLALPLSKRLYITPEVGYQLRKENKGNIYFASVLQYFIEPSYKGLYIKAGAHYDFRKFDEYDERKIWTGGLGYNFKLTARSRLGLDLGVIMNPTLGEYYYGLSYIFH